MAYTIDDISKGQEVFYYLLKNHELRESNEPQLYKDYIESEGIQTLVKSQGTIAECNVERYGDVVYLIPNMNNRFLGFTKAQLKRVLCRGNANDKDYYLTQFAIMVLLLEFYDGHGSSSKVRTELRVEEYQNSISRYLKEGAKKYDESEQEMFGIAFTDILHVYESLRSTDGSSRHKTTKEGFLFHLLRFLEDQGLIEYYDRDGLIKTTKKLDHFMDWNLLNKANYDRIISVLEGDYNAEN